MKHSARQIFRVVIGLLIFATGIVITVNANLGYSPWNVFHEGLSNTLGITLGQANIIVGIAILLINIVLGQPIGWATVLNMLLIGTFIDILMLNNLLPKTTNIVYGIGMILIGVLIQGYGCYIYVSAGFGAGPRDGMMVVLTKRTGKSVKLIKTSLEVIAVLVGMSLGGRFGVGTLLMAVFGGPIFQFAFKTVNFNIRDVKHRFIQDDLKLLKNRG